MIYKLSIAGVALAFIAALAPAGLVPARSIQPPFEVLVGMNELGDYAPQHKFGKNTDIDTAASEDIWDGGAVWVAPTEARLHLIASSVVSDTSAGTGARTVQIYGLDSAGALQNETVTMNGTTNVTTTNSYIMVHRMVVRTAGSNNANVGDISATAQTDSTVTAKILTGNNQTLMAIYQIPSDYSQGCIVSFYTDMNRKTTTGAADIALLAKPNGEVWQVKNVAGVVGAGTSHYQHRYVVPNCFAALTTLKMQATVSANDTDISAGFDIILVK